jgi:hypothetical protein
MKTISSILLLLAAISATSLKLSGAATGNVTISLRPSYVYIKSDTSEGAVLVNLSGYSTNDIRYRLFNGSSQYACWDKITNSYIAPVSYSQGPLAPSNSTATSSFWIIYHRGTNASAVASYRDRIGPGYSTNNNTILLPVAIPISDSFIIRGKIIGTEINNLSQKYVVLAWTGTSFVAAASTFQNTGDFTLYIPEGVSIDKIEIRTLDNLSVAEVNDTFSTFETIPDIQLVDNPAQNSRLNSIFINGIPLDGFTPGTKNYMVMLPVNISSIPITVAWVDNQGATAVIIPASDLDGDETSRTTSILVTAADGISTSTYKIEFKLSSPGSDAFLLNLLINGSPVPGFEPGIFTYIEPVLCGTNSIPVASYIQSDTNSTVILTNASNLNGSETQRTTTITVISEDATTIINYRVVFEIYVPATNSTLIDLSCNGATVDDFDPGIFEYNVVLPMGSATVPDVNYVIADENATAVISNAEKITGTKEECTTTVIVTAEDGLTSTLYKLVFSVYRPGNNSTLADISADGQSIMGFYPGTLCYNLILPVLTTNVPVVAFTKTDQKANAEIINASNLLGSDDERSTYIKVTSEDSSSISLYKVTFTVFVPAMDAFLSEIRVTNEIISNFSPGTFGYEILLPFGTDSVPHVTYSLSDLKASANVSIASNLHTTDEESTTLLRITAEDGITMHVYSVHFSVKLPASDAFLSDLLVNGTRLPGFTMGTFEYSMVMPLNTSSIPDVEYTKMDSKSYAEIINAGNLFGSETERTTTVIVIAEDGVTTLSYRIIFSVYVPGNDASLSDLRINGSHIDGFNPGIFEYTVSLPAGTSVIPSVSFTTSGVILSSIVSNASNLSGSEDERTITVIITAEDGITTSVYKVRFSVNVPGTNAYLSNLSINCTTLNGFIPDNFNYEVHLPPRATQVPPIMYILADPKATAILTNVVNPAGTEEERTAVIMVTAEDGVTRATYTILFTIDEITAIPDPTNTGISIYPVPALQQLTILGLATVNRLDILDITGKILRHIQITSDEMSLDISDLQAGVYFLRTESETLKFLKD